MSFNQLFQFKYPLQLCKLFEDRISTEKKDIPTLVGVKKCKYVKIGCAPQDLLEDKYLIAEKRRDLSFHYRVKWIHNYEQEYSSEVGSSKGMSTKKSRKCLFRQDSTVTSEKQLLNC